MDDLITCFVQAFGIPAEQVTDALAYQSIPQWDSVGHMALVAEVENRFNITLDINEIIGMNSVGKTKEILQKYGVGSNAPRE